MADDDFEIRIGDTWWSPKTWAVYIDGAGVDLTDGAWTVKAQIRRRARDLDVLHDFATAGVVLGTATAEVQGQQVQTSTVRLHIPATVAATLGEWTGVWDLELSHPTRGLDGGLWRKTIRGGRARVFWDVTH